MRQEKKDKLGFPPTSPTSEIQKSLAPLGTQCSTSVLHFSHFWNLHSHTLLVAECAPLLFFPLLPLLESTLPHPLGSGMLSTSVPPLLPLLKFILPVFLVLAAATSFCLQFSQFSFEQSVLSYFLSFTSFSFTFSPSPPILSPPSPSHTFLYSSFFDRQ